MQNKEQVFHLERFPDARGELYTLKNRSSFQVQRVFWIRKVPFGATRGNHAPIHNNELVVLTTGKCKVDIHNGKTWRSFCLEEPMEALLIPKMTWRTLYEFSPDCVLTVLADHPYVPGDVIEDFDVFLAVANQSRV